MQFKLVVSAAAIALVATIGSASAAEQFTTLEGVTAVAMSSGELATVTGTHKHFQLILPIGTETHLASFVAAGFSLTEGDGQSFQGGHMQNADGAGGVLDVCNFGGGC